MIRIRKSLITIYTAFIISFLMLIGGAKLVLCVEADGNAVIELIQGDCCASADAFETPSAAVYFSDKKPAGNQCSDCTDIPIFNRKTNQSINSNKIRLSQPQIAILPDLPQFKTILTGIASEIFSFVPLSNLNSVLSCLNTVILLI